MSKQFFLYQLILISNQSFDLCGFGSWPILEGYEKLGCLNEGAYMTSVLNFFVLLGGDFLSYFFVKKYLLVGVSSMLWTGQWISQ